MVVAVLVALALHSRPVSKGLATPATHKGLHVKGSQIVEGDGSPFVMRGVSHPYAWYKAQNQVYADVKRLGANTLRVVLDGQVTASEVADIVAHCKANRLICVLEYHDTTGHGEQAGSVGLDAAAEFWAGLRPVLQGQEDYVVVNLGNEPYGNAGNEAWTGATKAAIARVRAAGLGNLLMVDAPGWGQDWQGVMRGNAPAVLASDPRHNVAFSVHMYGVYDTAAKVTGYYDAFERAGLPLVVGEFGWKHTDGAVDADTIMREAGARGIGYLGWSWSGNTGGVEYLDVATGFDASSLTQWGKRLFDGPDGIRATAREAEVYAAQAG
ncbi:glycoside hydrolase family 5 protein [Dactylosporangium salmoneum]|uniref:glycoside hydrolase family 5 protein n=1 Tax=Dactylosporangium salmoneum TaxID=53361 RepID=UPI0031D7B1A1